MKLDEIYGAVSAAERRRRPSEGGGRADADVRAGAGGAARMAGKLESDGRKFGRTLVERGFNSRAVQTQKLVDEYIERCKDRPEWQAESEVLAVGMRKLNSKSAHRYKSGVASTSLRGEASADAVPSERSSGARPSTTPTLRKPSLPARENGPPRVTPIRSTRQYNVNPPHTEAEWEEHVKRQIAQHQQNRRGIAMAQEKVRTSVSKGSQGRDLTSESASNAHGSGVGALIDALEGSLPETKAAVLQTIPLPRGGGAAGESASPELESLRGDTIGDVFVRFDVLSGKALRKQREKSLRASSASQGGSSHLSVEGTDASVSSASGVADDEKLLAAVSECCENDGEPAERSSLEAKALEAAREGDVFPDPVVAVASALPASQTTTTTATGLGDGVGVEETRVATVADKKAADGVPSPPRPRGRGLTFRLVGSDIALIRMTLEANGFRRLGSKSVAENSVFPDFTLMWSSAHLKAQSFMCLGRHQKVNQFPKSYELTRKDRLCMNIELMQQTYGLKRFSIIPDSFVLPRDRDRFEDADRRDASALWIVKPASDACGRGIFIVGGHSFRSRAGRGEFMESNYIGVSHPSQGRVYNQIENRLRLTRDEETGLPMTMSTSNPVVVSKYISNPLLVDGFKFDIRIYVCVMGFDPLRIFIYDEGLVRFAVEPYSVDTGDLDNMHAHLTNYSINKSHPNYTAGDRCDVDDPEGDGEKVDDDIGHKWSLSALKKHFEAVGVDHAKIFRAVDDVIVKALLAVDPSMAPSLKQHAAHKGNCFQLFGFDIMIDSALRPWLLEVNLSPSLSCDTPLDAKIKRHLIADLFTLVGVRKASSSSSSSAGGVGEGGLNGVDSAHSDARLGLRTAGRIATHAASSRSSSRRHPHRTAGRAATLERDFVSGYAPIRAQRSALEPTFLSDFYSASLHASRGPFPFYDRSRLSAGQRAMLRTADEEVQRAPTSWRRIMPCDDPADLASYVRMLGNNHENDVLLAAHALERRYQNHLR